MMGEPITCPCCKSENVKFEEVKVAVSGEPNVYWSLFAFWLCQSCGVMFQKVK